MSRGVVLFHTNTSALRAEKILKRAGLQVKLIPTPRQLSSDCGISLRFEWQDRKQVEAQLVVARVENEIHALD